MPARCPSPAETTTSPASLDSYIATSAWRIRVVKSSPRSPCRAMPTDAVTSMRSRSRATGSASARTTPSGTPRAPRPAHAVGALPGPRLATGHRQDRELVTAEPGHRAVGRAERADPRRDGDQQPVTDVVAEGDVDVLELVEVQQQQGDPPV